MKGLHVLHALAVSLCMARGAWGIGDAFFRWDAAVDCQANCKALGQVAVDVGVPSKTLCAAVENGKLAYGTWMKSSSEIFNQPVCRTHSFSTGSYERVNGYDCICKAAATVLSWKADLACAAGPSAAAQAPAVCRIKKPGGGDYQVGWFEAKPGGGTCYMGDVRKMRGGQSSTVAFSCFGPQLATVGMTLKPNWPIHALQLLCTPPPKPAGVKRFYGKPDCGFTCGRRNLATIASSDATPGKVVCINKLGPASYGTTLNGNCSYFSDTSSHSRGEQYMCACRGKADELSWKQSDLCAKVPLGAATKPSICLIKKPGANDFRIGAWKSTTNSCLVASLPWGAQGQQVFNVSGLGGALQTKLLCRSPADTRQCVSTTASRAGLAKIAKDLAASPTQGSMIYDSRPGYRWQGINESDYSCPPGSPRRADASSFVSWTYWTALGAGPDYLNGLNWKDGYLASMKANGKPVAQSAWVTLPFNKHVLVTPASTQAARLGDLVFFGYGSSKHVGLYVGGNQMVSFAGNLTGKDYGLPRLESVYARGDIDQIRQVLRAPCMARTAGSLVGPPGTYTDFLALA
ncbi:hypothetical protein ABPG77_011250 [Micractinium sp. CCAP 211/92]